MQKTVKSEDFASIHWRMDAIGDVFTVVERIDVNTVISTFPLLVISMRDLRMSATHVRARNGALKTNTSMSRNTQKQQ